MLRIFICEDDAQQLTRLTKLVDDHIKKTKNDMAIEISTQFPGEIISILPLQNTTGLYFLDINLSCSIDAYKLSAIIRKYDPRAFIVIVTSDRNAHSSIFKHAIEAMDYIVKDTPDFDERIKACINTAFSRYVANFSDANVEFTIKLAEDSDTPTEMLSRGTVLHLNSADILYVESSYEKVHHICFHMRNKKTYLVRRSLKDAEAQLKDVLVRCHGSYLVNKNMISSVDYKNRKLTLVTGKALDIGRRHLKNFSADEKQRQQKKNDSENHD